MTAPGFGQTPAGSARPAPPPNPKIQAVTFALELATIRATAGTAAERLTDVSQLIADAEQIAAFIG